MMLRFIKMMMCLLLVVLPGCSLSVDTTTLDFGSAETSKTFTLTIQGPLKWSISCNDSWVIINPDNDQGRGTYNINVTVDRTGLAIDDYEATLNISTTPSVSSPDVIVKMNVPDVSPIPSEVSGYVYEDATNDPISGVLVSIGDNTYSSDSDGYYSINVEPGSYTINASKEGYEDYSSSIEVPEDDSIDHDIYMITEGVVTSSTTAPTTTPTTAPTTTPTTAPTTTPGRWDSMKWDQDIWGD